jgi:predicted adenine nucleotide alpha hydrolase (AANH) superfamily ATPase
MADVVVVDPQGRALSPTSVEKARRLIQAGKAVLVQTEPMTIQLQYEVAGHPSSRLAAAQAQAEPAALPGAGQRILLHTCCAPCATYSVRRLREQGFDVAGHWYNPNIHPFSEHERRREALAGYSATEALTVLWEPGYELTAFLRTVCGHEQFRARCQLCYQMRLERTAAVAAREGYDAFTTTLLISPYQDQQAIRSIGERLATQVGVRFYYENLRRGWAEHWTITRQHELYTQRYCGCIYSEWEAQDKGAATLPPSTTHGNPQAPMGGDACCPPS